MLGQTKSNGRLARSQISTSPDGAITVTLIGELDHEGVIAVERDIQRAVEAAVGELSLDCFQLTFVDSAGLRLLLQAQMAASARGVRFVLDHPADNVVRLLHLTGLDALIEQRN